jgi:HAD superfamily hydrolase (TIGR01509 family)
VSLPIRAVFLDFDGVLVDSEPLHYECWAQVLRPLGIIFSQEDYNARYVGVSNRAMVQDLCARFGRPEGQDFYEAQNDKKKVLYAGRAATELRIPADLISLLLTPRDGLAFGVVTSSNRSEVEPCLIAAGIRDQLAVLVCDRDAQRLKPEPDPYLKALELLNAQRGETLPAGSCLVVEDSGPGVESARRAGMPVLHVRHPDEVATRLQTYLADNRYYVK